MTEIKFGTDGWRGVIADDFTYYNVRKVAGAIAAYVLKYEDPFEPVATETVISATLSGSGRLPRWSSLTAHPASKSARTIEAGSRARPADFPLQRLLMNPIFRAELNRGAVAVNGQPCRRI